MALKPCRECGHQVSTEAETCPNCGVSAPTSLPDPDSVQCPNCGSSHTQKMGAGAFAIGSLIGGGCMLWIPIVGWVLAPIFFLLALVFGAMALLPSGRVGFHCQACKKWFAVKKSDLAPRGEA